VKEKMIRDYIVALTNLYGIVPKEKVVEIYNQQNEDKMTYADLSAVSTEDLEKGFVYVYPDHFVNDSIDEFDEFDIFMAKKAGKPYYVPKKQELLKYVDSLYIEDNKAYRKLITYMKKHIIEDEERALAVCEDLYLDCRYDFSIQLVMEEFNRRKISFKGENQLNEVLQLVMDLANNVRIWENNGHTPQEMFDLFDRPHTIPIPDQPFAFKKEKIGPNAPCPCGSGKKYKKCCMGRDDREA
jgi:hypothetical protein